MDSAISDCDIPPNERQESAGPERGPWWTIWGMLAAFGAYFCMYAFRKPFTAATYEGAELGGVELKTVLVTAQVIGYAISKFVGIRIISEMPPGSRAMTLIGLVLAAELALVLFGIVPQPWNVVCMFLNGLPLGMVFGLVMGFLEGRRVTELLSAGLCASFIVADGATKSVGAWLLALGVSQFWMPAMAGAMFLMPLVGFVTMLARIPPPNEKDLEARSERVQMKAADRWLILKRYRSGLIALVLMYLMVTILRSLRADFAAEIWRGLGESAAPAQFTTSEMIIAFCVVVINGSLVLVRDNARAFRLSLVTCLVGFLMIVGALVIQQRSLSSFGFMVLIGLGLYLPYVAVHATIFERLLAVTRDRGNVGFLMYLADSTGYLGYVVCMFSKSSLQAASGFLPFFISICWIASILSVVCVLFAGVYFTGVRFRHQSSS